MTLLTYKRFTLTTERGLLLADGEVVPLPFADVIARHHGFLYVERLVKYLEGVKND